MKYRPFLVIVSAPSGAGKTTITNEILRRNSDLKYSISATTRPRRDGETDGSDYFFMSRDAFKKRIERGDFAEWAIVHQNYYGTPIGYITQQLKNGHCIVMDIDIQGARQLRNKFPDSVSIFIIPPTLEILSERLNKRGTDEEDVVKRRLDMAKEELLAVQEYEYVVVNDNVEDSVRQAESIIHAEKNRLSRQILPSFFQDLYQMHEKTNV